MNRKRRVKQNTAILLLFSMLFLQIASVRTVQAETLLTEGSRTLQSYDAGWKQTEAGKWTYLKNGAVLRSAWLCDHANGSRWYVLDENGVMAEGPLVHDRSTGKYYLLNSMVHDGTFGSVITSDGSYYGLQLVFHKEHDGTYGALEDEAQIRVLAGLLGVQEAELKTVEETGKKEVSVSCEEEPEELPDTHIYSISYDFAGGDDYYENPRGYTKSSETVILKEPVREGYTFLGWTEDEEKDPVKEMKIRGGSTGDRNFTAHWTQQICTVKAEVNDSVRGSVETAEVKVPYGSLIRVEGTDLYIGETKITAAATPSTAAKTYTFHDWASPLSVRQDTVVYANFSDGTDLCTVTLRSDHAGKPEVTETIVKGSHFYAGNYFDEEGCITVRITDQTGSYFVPDFDTIGKDTVLTAHIIKDYYEDFEKLEHVRKVKRGARESQYYLYFEQPLDWEDPSSDSFIQKVQVILESPESINVLGTEGYTDTEYSSLGAEPVYLFNGNFISPEHRFFGCSVPAGLCVDSPAYWQYLTTENSAADTHRVRTELGLLLSGKWVSTGASKGGLTTNLLAYYYPEDCDVWMPYVAPLCSGIGDPRFMEFLNETAGNDDYGSQKAAKMRQNIMDVLCWCEENREALAPAVWKQKVENGGLRLAKGVTPEILLELCLLDYQATCWQTNIAIDPEHAGIRELKELLENPGVSMETKIAKIVEEIATEGGYETNSFAYSYYIQSYAELGQFYWTTAYLQEALEARGSDVKTAIPADADPEYVRDLILTDAIKQAVCYDSSTYEQMIRWINSTDQKIMMIFGSCDPWTSVRIPAEEGKENIRVYIMPGRCHSATLGQDAQIRQEALNILNGWLGITQPE